MNNWISLCNSKRRKWWNFIVSIIIKPCAITRIQNANELSEISIFFARQLISEFIAVLQFSHLFFVIPLRSLTMLKRPKLRGNEHKPEPKAFQLQFIIFNKTKQTTEEKANEINSRLRSMMEMWRLPLQINLSWESSCSRETRAFALNERFCGGSVLVPNSYSSGASSVKQSRNFILQIIFLFIIFLLLILWSFVQPLKWIMTN